MTKGGEQMKDTRGFEIKKLLKSKYPNNQFRVRLHKYSMGESIYVNTDLIVRQRIPDPRGYGYTEPFTDESNKRMAELKELLRDYESVDRDQWGEILSGGNTYLFIESL